jgi:hypothetical protein
MAVQLPVGAIHTSTLARCLQLEPSEPVVKFYRDCCLEQQTVFESTFSRDALLSVCAPVYLVRRIVHIPGICEPASAS